MGINVPANRLNQVFDEIGKLKLAATLGVDFAQRAVIGQIAPVVLSNLCHDRARGIENKIGVLKLGLMHQDNVMIGAIYKRLGPNAHRAVEVGWGARGQIGNGTRSHIMVIGVCFIDLVIPLKNGIGGFDSGQVYNTRHGLNHNGDAKCGQARVHCYKPNVSAGRVPHP